LKKTGQRHVNVAQIGLALLLSSSASGRSLPPRVPLGGSDPQSSSQLDFLAIA